MNFNYPCDEHAYRQQTAGQASSKGCMRPSFKCTGCGQFRLRYGSKKLKGVQRCAVCVEARKTKEGL